MELRAFEIKVRRFENVFCQNYSQCDNHIRLAKNIQMLMYIHSYSNANAKMNMHSNATLSQIEKIAKNNETIDWYTYMDIYIHTYVHTYMHACIIRTYLVITTLQSGLRPSFLYDYRCVC